MSVNYDNLREDAITMVRLTLYKLGVEDKIGFRIVFFENRKQLGYALSPRLDEPYDFSGKPLYIIGINKNQPEEYLEDTIVHETCHVVDHYKNGTFAHGKTWKALMRKCGVKPNATTDLTFEECQKLSGEFLWVLYDGDKPVHGFKRKPTSMVRAIENACEAGHKFLRLNGGQNIRAVLKNMRTGEEYRIS